MLSRPLLLSMSLVGIALAASPPARLLFKSGFDGDLSLLPVSGGYSQYQKIQGIDRTTGFRWPIMLWNPHPDLTGLQEVVTSDNANPAPENVSTYIQNTIETVAGPAGTPTHALRMEVIKDFPHTCCIQDNLQIAGVSQEITDVYIRFWLKLNPGFLEQVQSYKKDFWRTIWETKTTNDYRIAAYIYGDTAGHPYWYVQADNNTGSGAPRRQYWEVPNHTVPVPVTQWLSVEVYLHRSAASGGRFYWGVNGQTIADRSGANYGSNNEKINLLMFSNVYGYGRPAYQWVDDLEVWNFPPCDHLPCGASGGNAGAGSSRRKLAHSGNR
ncbi:MAG: hypothetical protein ABI833_23805 [Acidobacteriota bacterium]